MSGYDVLCQAGGGRFPWDHVAVLCSPFSPCPPFVHEVWALVSDSVGRGWASHAWGAVGCGSALYMAAEDKSPKGTESPVQWACFQPSRHRVTSPPQVVLRLRVPGLSHIASGQDGPQGPPRRRMRPREGNTLTRALRGARNRAHVFDSQITVNQAASKGG